jgi:hypothetical protein
LIQEKLFSRLNALTEDELSRMSFSDLAQLARTAEGIERRARNEPDSISRTDSRNVHVGGLVQIDLVEVVVRSRVEAAAIIASPTADCTLLAPGQASTQRD